MNSNQNKQNAWITDLNNSEDSIKRKEKLSKILKYFVFFAGCSFLLIVVFILSKTKLQVVNPKLTIATIDSNNPVNNSKIIEHQIKTSTNSSKTNTNVSKNLSLKEISEKNDNYLAKNRPKSSLNENKVLINTQSQKKNGKYITYYDNGNKWVELNFVNGLREGIQYTWHRNGQLKSELHYANGKKHGVQKWLQKNGEILNEKKYSNGEWQKN